MNELEARAAVAAAVKKHKAAHEAFIAAHSELEAAKGKLAEADKSLNSSHETAPQ